MLGPLSECGHCVKTYSMCLPMVPTIAVPTALGLDGALWAIAGGAVTLALFLAVTVTLRKWRHPASTIVQTIVMLAVGVQGYGLAVLLRA